jgi:hypothetical protein
MPTARPRAAVPAGESVPPGRLRRHAACRTAWAPRRRLVREGATRLSVTEADTSPVRLVDVATTRLWRPKTSRAIQLAGSGPDPQATLTVDYEIGRDLYDQASNQLYERPGR